MPETRTEWAARSNRYDSTADIQVGSDREHAEFIADSIATYLASLSGTEAEGVVVESVDLVSREVTVEDDGTQIIRPWKAERAGRVVE